jgi:hypothetical protein
MVTMKLMYICKYLAVSARFRAILTHGSQPQRGRVKGSQLGINIGHALCQEVPQFHQVPTPCRLVQRVVILPILSIHYEGTEL